MSDSTATTRSPEHSPVPKDPSGVRPAPDGSQPPVVSDTQPTVITKRPPMVTDSVSDSAVRILHGRILPGDRLGHFELVQYVGGGGMGRVFRALDTRLARTVALKILPPEQAADRETLLRFQNEAQSAARLDHENIARVHYVGEDRGLHYIVFEFVEGVNIRELVETKGPLPLAEAISYTLQVAEALAHAAGRNVVHRDIKPSNLLITPAGQVKLIDMGLARLREANHAAADLTASGVTLGTFDYISPEQARDPRNADVRSDIYSLGCTFFFMLTGRPPFLGGTMLQKLLQHQGDQPPDVRQFRPALPDDVSRVLRKMLAKDPRHRHATPVELVQALMAVAEAIGLRRATPGGWAWVLPEEPQVPFIYRQLPWLVPLVALLGIVLALDSVWSRLDSPDAEPPLPPAVESEPAPGVRPTGVRDAEASRPDTSAVKPSAEAKEKPPAAASKLPVPGPAEPKPGAVEPVKTGPPGPARNVEPAKPSAPGGPSAEPGRIRVPSPSSFAAPPSSMISLDWRPARPS